MRSNILCVKTRWLHESPGLVIIHFVRLVNRTLPFVFSGETVRLCMRESENPNLRLRSCLELWSRSWHGWFLEQNISRREVVEFLWDTQNTQTIPYWEYWEYMGWKGTERQCGNGPLTSVLMEINNLEIRKLLTKLSLGITLVVWIRESGSNSYQEKTRSGKHLD